MKVLLLVILLLSSIGFFIGSGPMKSNKAEATEANIAQKTIQVNQEASFEEIKARMVQLKQDIRLLKEIESKSANNPDKESNENSNI